MTLIEEVQRIIRKHEQKAPLSSPFTLAQIELRERAAQMAAAQGGWLDIAQANWCLSQWAGKVYDANSTPLYLAVKRKSLATVPGEKTGAVRIEIGSFLSYLGKFAPREREGSS